MKHTNNKESSSDLIKKGKSNATTALVFFLVNTITALILNPILVTYLGSYYFGIWRSLEKFMIFATVGDGQANQALKWTIAHQEASDNHTEKRELVASSLVIWVLFLPILLTIIAILYYFSSSLVNDIEAKDYMLVSLIVIILGINLIIKPLTEVSQSVLIGTNRGFLVNNIKTFWLIIISIATYIMIVHLNFKLLEMAISIVVVTLLRGVHYFYITKREVTWFGLARPNKKDFKVFLSFSSWKLAWSFFEKILVSSEIIFLSILIGSQIVSQYIFSSYVAIAAVMVVSLMTSGFNPGIGKLVGNKEYDRCQVFIANQREFVLFFSMIIAGSILLLNKSFVLLWGGAELYLGDFNNLLITLLMIQLVIIRSEASLIDLSLDIRNKVLITLLSIIVSSSLAILGYYYIEESISSIFIGLFIGRLILFIIFPHLTNNMIHQKKVFISAKRFILIGLFLTTTYYLGTQQTIEHWYAFLLLGLIESILFALVSYFLFLSKDNKVYIKSKTTNIIKRIQQ